MANALAGRRIVITGAASGIGAATAELFFQEGAALALLDRPGAALDAMAARLGATALPADVADEAAVDAAMATAEAALGGIDGLVNAAGILRQGGIAGQTLAQWDEVLAVNLTGTMLVCRAALPALHRAGGGTIVNFASIAGLRPMADNLAYAVSKAAVIQLTKCIAMEQGPAIRANALCPGLVETPMTGVLPEAALERLAASAIQHRLGKPAEIAQAVLYLTSAQSSFVHGTAMAVDGGWTYY
ncbi:SDR family NAD(P)-dependent oxidoreductase [Novosphingobium bradum]|uniref:SDR family NAD(P)-dependent oxidoreductase n=1 Tax=Novosphingobium bradum TaxID=1737444 RepID=A0ABV7IMC2_9SPHN